MMLEIIKKTREYIDYIEEHYLNVQKAWEIIQDKCKGMRFLQDDFVFFGLDTAVKKHDISKFTKEEFIPYRDKFFPVEGIVVNSKSFELAWEHHKEKNDHHWQTWTELVKDETTLAATYADIYIVHMIVDWVAMGMKFGDTAEQYYETNKDNINIPKKYEKFMYEIFEKIKECNNGIMD